MEILGIDIGGSGMKAAVVNTETGERITERFRIPTPAPATPEAMAKVVKELVDHFKVTTDVGCSFPAVVSNGKCLTAGNLSKEWVGVQIDELFSSYCNGVKFHVANDADLAALAEMKMGAGKGEKGKAITITIGTGLGSGLFYNGQLIPNMELGSMLHTDGEIIEKFAADSARKREDLSLKQWVKRFNVFLSQLEAITRPDLLILGGGISKKFDKFKDRLTSATPVKPAHFLNYAGIVGAAVFAEEKMKNRK